MVAAPEHGEPDVGERTLFLTLERLHKPTSIIGGLALVGSREDDHRSVCRNPRLDRVKCNDAGMEALNTKLMDLPS